MDTETITPETIDDVWGVAELDVDAYLDRIGLSGPDPGLPALHAAHVRAIPFENIDPVLGWTPDLNLVAVADKLLTRRRGGYCYELDDSRRLVGDELTVEHAGGRSVTTVVAPGDLGVVLRELDLDLGERELQDLVARGRR